VLSLSEVLHYGFPGKTNHHMGKLSACRATQINHLDTFRNMLKRKSNFNLREEKGFSKSSAVQDKLLTCQLPIASHIGTKAFTAPPGFKRTCQSPITRHTYWNNQPGDKLHTSWIKEFPDIYVHPSEAIHHQRNWMWGRVNGSLEFTIAQSPRNASSFSISSRILEKNGNTISRATLRDQCDCKERNSTIK
jgi:hypothetical protein